MSARRSLIAGGATVVLALAVGCEAVLSTRSQVVGAALAAQGRSAQGEEDHEGGALVLEPAVIGGVVRFDPDELERVLALSPVPELPPDPTNAWEADPRAARLGHWLFFDPRLSRDGDVSCATCHEPAKGWSDGRQLAQANGQFDRHTQSLWNVAYNRWFFWDGRSDSLWSQALKPFEEPREHGTTRLAIVHLVDEDPALRRAYEETFGPLGDFSDRARFPEQARPARDPLRDPAGVDPENPVVLAWQAMAEADRAAVDRVYAHLGKALAAYERAILSTDSAFDRFVAGVRAADPRAQRGFDEAARRGLKLFLGKARCHLCHSGPLFTDREFHNNRVPPLEGGSSTDHGRFSGITLVQGDPFNGVGAFSDDPEAGREKVGYLRRIHHNVGEFKTPGLRNVAQTAPYMHQGQLATLEDVVRYYSTLEDALPVHRLGGEQLLAPTNLDEGEIRDLVVFLESLTGTALDPALERAPAAPYLE